MKRCSELLLALVSVTILITTSSSALALEDTDFWMREGQQQILRTLGVQHNFAKARNIIIFIGDGMGMNTVTAARIYQGQRHGRTGEEQILSFEKFPYIGLAKTYNVDKQVPDSAATATAILTGVKVKYSTLGLDPTANLSFCDPIGDANRRLPGLFTWAQQAGKSTGIVTTARITHATPAAGYAYTNDRDWECDGEIPVDQRSCLKDIARQLVEDAPGNKLNVMLGGGWKQMGVVNEQDNEDSCIRSDGRNLATEWLERKKGQRALYVNNTDSLMTADLSKVDHLLGVFSPGHIPYVSERTSKHPSLTNMTLQAIKLLKRNKNGYFLLVEAARIDHGHHDNMARLALEEACELDETVASIYAAVDPKDTLIVVTADHSHAMTMNGYPERGQDILGFANEVNETTYETLSYANGPGYSSHRVNGSSASGTADTWVPLETMDRSKARYKHLAAMHLKKDTHSGEDVVVYSTGPFAHLFTGVFEQNYLGHAMSYAACIGPSETLCRNRQASPENSPCNSASSSNVWQSVLVLGVGMFCAALW